MDLAITPLFTIACLHLTSLHFTSTIIVSTLKCHHNPCTAAFGLNLHPLMPRTISACRCLAQRTTTHPAASTSTCLSKTFNYPSTCLTLSCRCEAPIGQFSPPLTTSWRSCEPSQCCPVADVPPLQLQLKWWQSASKEQMEEENYGV